MVGTYGKKSNSIRAEKTKALSLYSFVIKKISEFGGLMFVLYLAMWILVRTCTRNQMESYLVSELYAYQNKQTQSYNPDK